MLKFTVRVLFIVGCAAGLLMAAPQEQLSVKRLDPELDKLVSPSAKLETILKGSGFFEGTNWVRDSGPGYLIFSDISGDVINKRTPDGKVSVIVDRIFIGSDPSKAPQSDSGGGKMVSMIGSDGTTIDLQGRIVYCEFGNRRISRLEKDGKRTVLAERAEGKRFNTPNDLVYKNDGALYFTDTRTDTIRADNDPDKGTTYSGVFLLRNDQVQVLTKDMATPNGLAFSPDEKYLYIDSTSKKTITRFDVNADDTISNPKLIIDMTSDTTVGNPDGMRVDKKGYIYCTGPGGLWIVSPEGKHLGTILTPQRLTNLAFGDNDGRTLYMVSPNGLYRIRMIAAGTTYSTKGR